MTRLQTFYNRGVTVNKNSLLIVPFMFMVLLSACSNDGDIKPAYKLEQYEVSGVSEGRLIYSFYNDASLNSKEVDLLSDKKYQNKTLAFLYEYYRYARKDNNSALINLHFLDDGSAARFKKQIDEGDDPYPNFEIISKVIIDQILVWGDYNLVGLRYYDPAKNKYYYFSHLVYCNVSVCKMSNRMFAQDDYTSLFSLMLSQPGSSKLPANSKNDYIEVTNLYGKSHPISFCLTSKKLKSTTPIQRNTKSLPLVSIKGYKTLFKFISDSWSIDKNSNYRMDSKEISSSGLISPPLLRLSKNMKDIYTKYWTGNMSRALIPSFKSINTDKNELKNQYYNNESIYRTATSLMQNIIRWKKYIIGSYLVKEDDVYFWVVYETNKGDKGNMIFVFDKKTSKLKNIESAFGQFISNPLVLKQYMKDCQ